MYFIWSKPYKTVIYIKLTSFDAEICAEQEKSHIFNNKWVVPIGIAHFYIINRCLHRSGITVKMFLSIRYCMSLKSEEQEMYMRLTPREKEMADMFEQMSKEEQEIMIELAKRMRTEEPEKLLKEIKQRLNIDDGV